MYKQSLDNKEQQVPTLSPPSDTSSSLNRPFKPTTHKPSPQLKHSPPPSPLLQVTSIPTPLSKADTRKTTQILSSLQKHTSAWPFLCPVDPSIDPAPNYFEIIANPIDLSTIATRLKNGHYNGVDEFVKDLRLMFSNCFEYNPVGHLVNDEGMVLEKHLSGLLGNFYPEYEEEASKKRKTRSINVHHHEEDHNQKQEEEFIQYSSSSDSESPSKILPKKRKKIQKNTYYYKKKLLLQSQNPSILPKKKLQHANRQCAYCGTDETPMWRRGPEGCGTLCNKCGVKWRHGKILSSSKPPVKKPQRKPVTAQKKSPVNKPKSLSSTQKQTLSQKINSLPVSELGHVISIIQDETVFLNGDGDGGGDMELDLNALSDGCCGRLWEFCYGSK